MELTLDWWPDRKVRRLAASRTDRTVSLTDEQWKIIEDLFPWEPPTRAGGRPQVKPRPCFEGVCYVLRTGCRWKDLPPTYPSPATCHRRFMQWTQEGLFEEAWRRLIELLVRKNRIKLDEGFADGTFASAKRGV